MVLTYAGYTANVAYVEELECYRGTVSFGENDTVVFESDQEKDVENDFHTAVDNHLRFRKDLGVK